MTLAAGGSTLPACSFQLQADLITVWLKPDTMYKDETVRH